MQWLGGDKCNGWGVINALVRGDKCNGWGVINAMVGVRTAMQGVVRDKRNMHPALVASLSHVSSSSLLLFSNYVIA